MIFLALKKIIMNEMEVDGKIYKRQRDNEYKCGNCKSRYNSASLSWILD